MRCSLRRRAERIGSDVSEPSIDVMSSIQNKSNKEMTNG